MLIASNAQPTLAHPVLSAITPQPANVYPVSTTASPVLILLLAGHATLPMSSLMAPVLSSVAALMAVSPHLEEFSPVTLAVASVL